MTAAFRHCVCLYLCVCAYKIKIKSNWWQTHSTDGRFPAKDIYRKNSSASTCAPCDKVRLQTKNSV